MKKEIRTRRVNVTLKQLQKEMDRCLNMLGLNPIPLSVNGKISKTLGRYWHPDEGYPLGRIEMSKVILTAPYEEVMDVLHHEIAHYVGYMCDGDEGSSHSSQPFRDACDRLKCNPESSGKYNVIYRYETYCTECGQRTGRTERTAGWVTHPECYHSNCCGAKIKIVEYKWGD